MGEISKAVGQWIVANVGWSIIIFLFLLSGLFKITKREVDPLGWVLSWIGKAFTKDVRNDILIFKTETHDKFEEVKKDRAEKIQELKSDYNEKIADLRSDLDAFEVATKANMSDIQSGTTLNCNMLKKRLEQMEKSNDMQTVRQIKGHVLDFANSCLNGVKHTKQDFENIIKENEEYEELVEKYGLRNDVYTEDFKYVMDVYHKCQQNHSFLKSEDV